MDRNATGHNIGEVKTFDGRLYIVQVGAFTDKVTKEPYSQLTWYKLTGKQSRKFLAGRLTR